jgi:hypothetical protein
MSEPARDLEMVVVERTFAEPVNIEELQAIDQGNAWHPEMHRVTFSHTYVAVDGERIVCVYRAPDALRSGLRKRQAKLPFDRIWPASRARCSGGGE